MKKVPSFGFLLICREVDFLSYFHRTNCCFTLEAFCYRVVHWKKGKSWMNFCDAMREDEALKKNTCVNKRMNENATNLHLYLLQGSVSCVRLFLACRDIYTYRLIIQKTFFQNVHEFVKLKWWKQLISIAEQSEKWLKPKLWEVSLFLSTLHTYMSYSTSKVNHIDVWYYTGVLHLFNMFASWSSRKRFFLREKRLLYVTSDVTRHLIGMLFSHRYIVFQFPILDPIFQQKSKTLHQNRMLNVRTFIILVKISKIVVK